MSAEATSATRPKFNRRTLFVAAAGALSLVTAPALARTTVIRQVRPKQISFVVPRTGEHFSDVFSRGSEYDTEALSRINYLLRDVRTGDVTEIDPAVLEVAARMQARISRPFHIICGYRSPATNQQLRHRTTGVAKNSFHLTGQALDILVPGISSAALGKVAGQCGAGGIGIYRSGFVHIDSGPRRTWKG